MAIPVISVIRRAKDNTTLLSARGRIQVPNEILLPALESNQLIFEGHVYDLSRVQIRLATSFMVQAKIDALYEASQQSAIQSSQSLSEALKEVDFGEADRALDEAFDQLFASNGLFAEVGEVISKETSTIFDYEMTTVDLLRKTNNGSQSGKSQNE